LPIRWNPAEVREAADEIEKLVKDALPILERARDTARKALKIPNLPQYVVQKLHSIIGEVDRATGGTHFDPVGRYKSALEGLRKSLPKSEMAQDNRKYGDQVSLM